MDFLTIEWLLKILNFSFKIKHLCFLFASKMWLFVPVSSSAGRGRSWEDQPGVSGWEKRPGCDLLGPEALLRQYLPGAAGRSLRLSVAPSLGPGWDFARSWSTLLHYSGGPGSWRWHQHGEGSGAGLREPQSHTLTVSTRKAFSKVYFF